MYQVELEKLQQDLSEPNAKATVVLWENKMEQTAGQIAKIAIHNAKIVLVAGPSSSGKTTFSKKLCEKLREYGAEPILISLDDFFRDRDKGPRKEDGTPDFETVDALDLGLLERCFLELSRKRRALFPRFDFVAGKNIETDHEIVLHENSVMVVEGMHALNDRIAGHLTGHSVFKVYISLLTEVVKNGETFLDRSDLRLLRRMARDFRFRGSSPENTMTMWKSVLEGDEKYVFPFRDRADIEVDTFYLYDASVLKAEALPLLLEIRPDSVHYDYAQGLVEKLKEIPEVGRRLLPSASLLREFIGGSVYYPDNVLEEND